MIFLVISCVFGFGETVRGKSLEGPASCGEMCVRLICRFYNIYTTEHGIREQLQPTSSGVTTMIDLKRVFTSVGLCANATRGTIKDLDKIEYPIILHLDMGSADNVGHYIVCFSRSGAKRIGYDLTKSLIPFEITDKMLSSFWTGIYMKVQPQIEGKITKKRCRGLVWESVLILVILLVFFAQWRSCNYA